MESTLDTTGRLPRGGTPESRASAPRFLNSDPLLLPDAIDALLARLRRSIRAYVWIEGLATIGVWLGLAFWAGLALDWWLEPTWPARLAGIGVVAAVAMALAWRLILRRAFVPLKQHSLALVLERRYTSLGDRLLTTVDLTADPRRLVDYDAEMLDHTAGETLDALPDLRVLSVFHLAPLAWRVALAAMLGAAIAALAQASPTTWRFWLDRLTGSPEPWPRQTLLLVEGFAAEFAVVGDELHVFAGSVDAAVADATPTTFAAGTAVRWSTSGAAPIEVRKPDKFEPPALKQQRPAAPRAPDGLATIRRADRAEWAAPHESLTAGATLATGAYRLTGGIVELHFIGGVQVVVHGPSTFRVESSQRVAVDDGTLLVRVPARLPRFVVVHPRATLTARRRDTLKVVRGSDARLVVLADAFRALPESVELRYRTDAGAAGRETFQQDSTAVPGQDEYQTYSYTFENVIASIDLDIAGGDDRVRGLRIEAVDSPKLTAARLDCTFPEYLVDRQTGRYTPREIDVAGSAALPEGTRVVLRGTANRALSAVQVKALDDETPRMVRLPADRPDLRAFAHDLGVLAKSKDVLVTLIDTDGLANREPIALRLTATPDEPPTVATRLKGIGTAITPDAMLPLDGELTDDHALAGAWFLLRHADGRTLRQPFARPVRGQAKVTCVAPPPPATGDVPVLPAVTANTETLDLRKLRQAGAWELAPGGKLAFSIQAADAYNLGGGTHVSESDVRHLEIVTPDELLASLEAQEFTLRQRFETIIDELTETRALMAEAKPAAGDANASARGPALVVERVAQNIERSAFETAGLATAFEELRAELLNNRLDAPKHDQRLDQQIVVPLRRIVAGRFPELEAQIKALRQAVARGNAQPGPPARDQLISACQRQADVILGEMRAILRDMHELEDFNKLVEKLRSMMKRQEEIQQRTIKKRREGLLE